jgi:predicted ABC-type ATPase
MMGKSFETCVAEGVLSEIDNLRVYKQKKIYENYAKGLIPQEHPVAIILGGQNASGKSTLGKKFRQEYKVKGGIATIEGDALREYHPKFNRYNFENDKLMAAYTAKDSGRWTARLINDLAQGRYNMIVETTLRSREVVTGMVEKVSKTGYDVQAKVIVVSYDKSLLGSYLRYETVKQERGFGRFVHDHSLKAAYAGMPETLQALGEQGICSRIYLYTREKTLFEGDYRQTDIAALVKQERCRAYTPEEIRFLQTGWENVGRKMLARGAGKEEFAEVSVRMKNRIEEMAKEGVARENTDTMIHVYRDFDRQITTGANKSTVKPSNKLKNAIGDVKKKNSRTGQSPGRNIKL